MAENPDLIVSVDLGTTFTGVAWRTQKTPIQVINDWPGSGDRGERKVPTAIIYNADDSVSSWGFLCEDDDTSLPGKTRREFFKIFVDAETLEAAQRQGIANVPQSTEDARRYASDYLRLVYRHIKETIELQIGRRQAGGWTDMEVLFLFSVPTTWVRMEVINTFKHIIRDAGFGMEGVRHLARVDLTEAEAAAVATLKTGAVMFDKDSMFLTVDAGGGTTDLALMRTCSGDPNYPQMSQVAAVRGVGIGSILIDRAFAQLVAQRLMAYPDVQQRLPQDMALWMAKSHHFRIVKHKFGERVYMQPVFKIQMEGVSHEFNHAGLRIEAGKMHFAAYEIQALFDAQVEGIMKRITEQLDWLVTNNYAEQVQHVILSGGLGCSAYVRETIQQRMAAGAHPNAKQVAVVPCQDPQLVVVRGLLLDQQQKMETGYLSVLASRVARASYGVIVKEHYVAERHFNEELVSDPNDVRKKWAINQIQWLIKKGDVINPNSSLVKTLEMHLAANDTTREWQTHIVVSQNEPSFLPRSLTQAGVQKLCQVTSNLNGLEQHELVMKHKRGKCFTRGHVYYICKFDIRVIVAPADLRFELWFAGNKFSRNHEPVAVAWDDSGTKVGEK